MLRNMFSQLKSKKWPQKKMFRGPKAEEKLALWAAFYRKRLSWKHIHDIHLGFIKKDNLVQTTTAKGFC